MALLCDEKGFSVPSAGTARELHKGQTAKTAQGLSLETMYIFSISQGDSGSNQSRCIGSFEDDAA